MRNIWFILRRDLKRLIINPAAWVIIFGLTFIPALYAWFNFIGFWNPYGKRKASPWPWRTKTPAPTTP